MADRAWAGRNGPRNGGALPHHKGIIGAAAAVERKWLTVARKWRINEIAARRDESGAASAVVRHF